MSTNINTLRQFIVKNSTEICSHTRGVYFLIRDDEVVYVGQSVNCEKRVYTHAEVGTKKFDSYYVHEVSGDASLNDLESHLIFHFDPVYNTNLPPNDTYTPITQLASKCKKGIGPHRLRRALMHADVRISSGCANEEEAITVIKASIGAADERTVNDRMFNDIDMEQRDV